MALDDNVGIYLRSQGIPSGGETPGAGIFLNPQGGLDTDSFSNWFSGLAPPDQGAIAAAIANLGTPGAAPTTPSSTDPAATPEGVTNTIPGTNPPANVTFGTPASDPSTLPATFSPDGSTPNIPPGAPPLPATFTPQAPTPAPNLPGVPGSPTESAAGNTGDFGSPGGLPTVNIFGSQQAGYAIDQNGNPIPIPGSNPPVNTAGNPILNQVAQNFTGQGNVPAGATPQGNNGLPPPLPPATVPNEGMTPDMQAYILSRMNLAQPALGGLGGGVGI